jgi:hypothetical protein
MQTGAFSRRVESVSHVCLLSGTAWAGGAGKNSPYSVSPVTSSFINCVTFDLSSVPTEFGPFQGTCRHLCSRIKVGCFPDSTTALPVTFALGDVTGYFRGESVLGSEDCTEGGHRPNSGGGLSASNSPHSGQKRRRE